jgi:hypothetical protein
MHEWLIWHAWKACVPQGTEGSNPSFSARIPTIGKAEVGIFLCVALPSFTLEESHA